MHWLELKAFELSVCAMLTVPRHQTLLDGLASGWGGGLSDPAQCDSACLTDSGTQDASIASFQQGLREVVPADASGADANPDVVVNCAKGDDRGSAGLELDCRKRGTGGESATLG